MIFHHLQNARAPEAFERLDVNVFLSKLRKKTNPRR